MDGWLWISLPWATFAVIIRNGKVTDAAPVAKWAVGKAADYVEAYYKKRGAEIFLTREEPR